MAWKVDWSVNIGGRDLTSAWAPVLIDISVTDKAGEASDSCSLTIDDTDGRVTMPQKRQPLVVRLDGGEVFRGFVEKASSSGSRGGGRVIKVAGKGFDTGAKGKEPQLFHLDDADLGSFLGKAAENAGYSIKVDDALAAIQKDYWAADADSFIALGQQLARKYGATFKIRGDRAVFAKRGQQALGAVRAVYGENLIDWDITPRDPRRKFTGGKARWFDRGSASFKEKDLGFDGEDVEALNLVRSIAADEEDADAVLGGRKSDNDREGGSGSVTLDLAIGAVVEGRCTVVGAKPDIDGSYTIDTVKHSANRGGGATTSLDLKQPGAGGGKIGRKSGQSGSGDFALPAHETLG